MIQSSREYYLQLFCIILMSVVQLAPEAYLAKVIQELVHTGIARSQRGIGGAWIGLGHGITSWFVQ